MAINWGRLLASTARAGGNVMAERKQRHAQEAAGRQVQEERERKRTIEDALMQQGTEDRARQADDRARKRSLEDVLQGRATEEYEYKKTQRPLEQQALEARIAETRAQARRAPAGRAGSFTQMMGPGGTPVFYNPTTDETKSAPEGLQQGGAGAAGEKAKRIQALANVDSAIGSFEQTLKTTGSTILPGVGKSELGTDYENLQLQMKELFNLGVLNGPDLMLMRRIVNDPSSLRGRAEAGGSGAEQTKRVLAQIQKLREKMASFRTNLDAGNSAGVVQAKATDVGGIVKKYGLEP